jgi:hypothetical protein
MDFQTVKRCYGMIDLLLNILRIKFYEYYLEFVSDMKVIDV